MNTFEDFLASTSDAAAKGRPSIIRQSLSILDAADIEHNRRIDQGQCDDSIYLVRDALNNYRDAIIEGNGDIAEGIAWPLSDHFDDYMPELRDVTELQELAYNYILTMAVLDRALQSTK